MIPRALALAMWAACVALVVLAVVAGTTRRPAEVDPGWDCRTMGNHQCGPAPTCQGDTVAAPCAVVTRDDGSAVEWTTMRGD